MFDSPNINPGSNPTTNSNGKPVAGGIAPGGCAALRVETGCHSRSQRISVIVPVYEEEKILESTLKVYSRQLRDKYNIELVVSDGGSTDSTLEIARRHADVVVEHKKKHRQTIAEGRNCGARHARGDILVFINGDTVPADPAKFFELISMWGDGRFMSDSDALACTVAVAPSQRIAKDRIFYGFHNTYVRFLNCIGVGMGRGECQIVRKEAFWHVNGYNEKIAAGEDFDLYRRIGRHGRIKFAAPIVVYESPRRFRKYGYLRILWTWTVNSLAVMLCGKSVSKEWEAVR